MSATLRASWTRDMVTSFGRLTVVDATAYIDVGQYEEVQDGNEGTSRRCDKPRIVLCFGCRDSARSRRGGQPGSCAGSTGRPDQAPTVLAHRGTGRSVFMCSRGPPRSEPADHRTPHQAAGRSGAHRGREAWSVGVVADRTDPIGRCAEGPRRLMARSADAITFLR